MEYYVIVGEEVYGIWSLQRFAENHRSSLAEQGRCVRIEVRKQRV